MLYCSRTVSGDQRRGEVMLSAEAIQRIDQYWAGQLAISPDQLHAQALVVVPLPESSASFCFVFQHQAFMFVRVPPPYDEYLHQAITPHDRPSLLTPAWWQRALGTTPHRAIGPAYVGYADAEQFRPVIRHPARLLTPEDSAALAAFAGAVGPLAWEHSGLGDEPQPIAGCWEKGRLVAAAGYAVWGATLAHIGVTTHPTCRGSGYGRSVVSAIGQHALERGYVLQYRTLCANTPSMAIAAALGFEVYATTLFVALDTAPGG
jgi:RimJ/RimL family protein N-acetyltransferase